MKTLARLVGPVPGHDHPIELQNLLLESEQLSTERGKAGTGNLRDPLLVRVGNNAQQFCDPFTPDWRDNAELSEVRPDRINHRGRHATKERDDQDERQFDALGASKIPELIAKLMTRQKWRYHIP